MVWRSRVGPSFGTSRSPSSPTIFVIDSNRHGRDTNVGNSGYWPRVGRHIRSRYHQRRWSWLLFPPSSLMIRRYGQRYVVGVWMVRMVTGLLLSKVSCTYNTRFKQEDLSNSHTRHGFSGEEDEEHGRQDDNGTTRWMAVWMIWNEKTTIVYIQHSVHACVHRERNRNFFSFLSNGHGRSTVDQSRDQNLNESLDD